MSDTIQSTSFQPTLFSKKTTSKNIPKIPRHMIRAKIAYARQRFQDLDIFRQQIEDTKAGVIHQPYTYNKKTIFWYRLIFVAFGFLFFGLGLAASSLTSTIGCGLLFNSCKILKSLLICACVLLTFCSFLMAFYLSPERDAALKYTRKAKTILNAIYKRRKIRLGIKWYSLFGHQRQQAIALKHVYDEAYDRINDKKEAALHLLHRISTSPTIEYDDKETLLNQALEELNDKMSAITHAFRHTDI